MKIRNADKEYKTLSLSLRGLYCLLALTSLILWAYWGNGGEAGQFAKFVVHTVFMSNLFGILFIMMGIGTTVVVGYRVITKKASDSKKAMIYSLPLVAFFMVIGVMMSKDSIDNLKDVKNYLTGNIIEEHVVITHLEVYGAQSGGDDGYEYTFSDGRTFYENHQGKGYGNIIEGETYMIRYLPETPKLLSILLAQ
ncbi:hypothetical protein ACP8HI_25540 [Paenibacillus sp. FA6]|uniref:hypothetical protein n=1 Tax=Paenibacillus sp. FA6 TaxID=3413029 RepID=UPI003F65F68A